MPAVSPPKALGWCLLLFLGQLAGLTTAGISLAQESKQFDLLLKGGTLPKAQQIIRVKQNDQVELRWSTDLPINLHLHGYDVMISVIPGEPTVTMLKTRIAGRFSVEKLQDKKGGHHHGGKVLYLEVYP